MADESTTDPEILIEPLEDTLAEEVEERLRTELESCPDVAFAHLAQTTVAGRQAVPQRSLWVWLMPEAVGSLRAALNLVSEAVARALPEDVYLDVLILNSAPELLSLVEEAGCPLVERDPEERQRALDAAQHAHETGCGEKRPRLWPW